MRRRPYGAEAFGQISEDSDNRGGVSRSVETVEVLATQVPNNGKENRGNRQTMRRVHPSRLFRGRLSRR